MVRDARTDERRPPSRELTGQLSAAVGERRFILILQKPNRTGLALGLGLRLTRGRCRRVAFTVRRSVCYYEKSSTHAAKEFADAVPLRFKASDQKWGLPPGTLQSRFLVRRASCKPFRRYAFPGRANLWQSRQPMRQTLVEGRSDAANTRVARHWYRTQASCLASLQTRAILSTCSCADGVFGSCQPYAV